MQFILLKTSPHLRLLLISMEMCYRANFAWGLLSWLLYEKEKQNNQKNVCHYFIVEGGGGKSSKTAWGLHVQKWDDNPLESHQKPPSTMGWGRLPWDKGTGCLLRWFVWLLTGWNLGSPGKWVSVRDCLDQNGQWACLWGCLDYPNKYRKIEPIVSLTIPWIWVLYCEIVVSLSQRANTHAFILFALTADVMRPAVSGLCCLDFPTVTGSNPFFPKWLLSGVYDQ